MKLTITINGERREADGVWEGQSLLNALRDDFDLPGSKNACEQGECGSCSVYLDGTLVCSCLVLAAQAEGREVTTVEGIAEGDALHPVQEAFVAAGAVQCGFCTPGFVVATHDLLKRNPEPTDAEIREALAGNLCRCTGYEKILDAVRLAAGHTERETEPREDHDGWPGHRGQRPSDEEWRRLGGSSWPGGGDRMSWPSTLGGFEWPGLVIERREAATQ